MESYVPRSNYYSILPSLLLGFILGIILDGISSKEIDSKTRPNQGFHLSIKNGSMLFFIVFLLIDLTSSIVLIPILRASQSFQNIAFSEQIGNIQVITSALSLPISWFISMNNGGSAVIHHIIIRTILWLSGNTPLLYSKFLEYTCELTLLRQIGGAYEFSHPLLRDYLAWQTIKKTFTYRQLQKHEGGLTHRKLFDAYPLLRDNCNRSSTLR